MFEISNYTSKFFDIKPPEKQKDWIQAADDVIIHMRGLKPDKFTEQRRPNEDPEVMAYRSKNSESITKGGINRAFNRLFSLFQDMGYTWKVSEAGELFLKEEKFLTPAKEKLNFDLYLQQHILKRTIEDANGLLVWLPKGEGNSIEEREEWLMNPANASKKIKTEPYVVSCKKIYDITEENITFLSEEKSLIKSGDDLVKEGDVYYILTKDSFYKYRQFGDKSKKEFQWVLIYKHDIGEIPFIVNSGDWNADGYYESFFAGYVPFANEAAKQFSDWQAQMITCGYTVRQEQYMECDAPCDNGTIISHDDNGNMLRDTCTSCKGTGRLAIRSPYGVYQKKKNVEAIEGANNEDMLKFISPPVDILEHSTKAWETLLEKAEEALQLNFNKEAQSGVAKEYDREERDALITRISNNFFDKILYKSLYFIEKYLNIGKEPIVEVYKPVDLKIKTEADIIENINELSASGAPMPFLIEATRDLARKKFSGNPIISKVIEHLSVYDVMFAEKNENIPVLIGTGYYSEEDQLKHKLAYSILSAFAKKEPAKFEAMDDESVKNYLDAEIMKLAPKRPLQMINENGKAA